MRFINFNPEIFPDRANDWEFLFKNWEYVIAKLMGYKDVKALRRFLGISGKDSPATIAGAV